MKSTVQTDKRPNFLVIVADDLGYSDIGAFGGEIPTPNLDSLALRGVQLANFYVSPACSPSRAMLLTGRDNHAAGFGTMQEVLTEDQRGAKGYEGYIPRDIPTIAERLSSFGYETIMSGKWHLGAKPGQGPSDRGFEKSFALLQGAHNHFGADEANAYRERGNSPDYRLDGKEVFWPQGEFSSDVFANYLCEFLKQADPDRPFFAYLAFTAPHWPLQAPAAAISHYDGVYDGGPDAVIRARISRMKALGLIPDDFKTRTLGDQSRWDGLSVEKRRHEAREMEVYAAMVEELDRNVGRVVALLRQQGRLENTYVIFLSDNGPEGLPISRPIDPAHPAEPLDIVIDNSTRNLGAANSYFSYGPHWGQASAAPYWGTKEHTSEGGIRSPAIIAGPGLPGRDIDRNVASVLDVAPTILDLAGHPSQSGQALYTGISAVPALKNEQDRIAGQGRILNWELFYRAAVREGDMKAIYQPSRLPIFGKQELAGKVSWQLYDLAKDPGETKDLALDRPNLLHRMRSRWNKYAKDLGVVLLPEDR